MNTALIDKYRVEVRSDECQTFGVPPPATLVLPTVCEHILPSNNKLRVGRLGVCVCVGGGVSKR